MEKRSEARRRNERTTWRGSARRRSDEEGMSTIDRAARGFQITPTNTIPIFFLLRPQAEINNLLAGSAWPWRCLLFSRISKEPLDKDSAMSLDAGGPPPPTPSSLLHRFN